jgi:RNA-dependent RNA polymerase
LLFAGDYDGDTGLAIWQPEIVDSFIPADLKHSHEPAEVAECFSQENEKVMAFLERVALEPPMTKLRALQEVLLGDLRDSSIVGQYSGYHDNATYELGYAHPKTVRLAYM